MGKNINQKKGKGWILVLGIAVAALALLCVVLGMKQSGGSQQLETRPLQTQPETTAPAPTEKEIQVQINTQEPVQLEDGLRMLQLGNYTGIYMEDGTDEIVSDVMMIILENTSDQDLQLARVEIDYPQFTAQFEATNLPAGEAVVLLEKNRHSLEAGTYIAARTSNVIFFPEAMETYPELLEITGVNGSLNVHNTSGEDITGDFYIYYKNSAVDLLYGGITYRVRVEGGIGAGETVRVIAGHYSENNSRILMVSGIE